MEKTIAKLKSKADISEKAKAEYEKKLNDLSSKIDSEKAVADERIKELETQLGKAGGDEALIEYKFYFAGIQENFKKFIAVIDKIDDLEKKAKFKGAAIKFLRMTLEELK